MGPRLGLVGLGITCSSTWFLLWCDSNQVRITIVVVLYVTTSLRTSCTRSGCLVGRSTSRAARRPAHINHGSEIDRVYRFVMAGTISDCGAGRFENTSKPHALCLTRRAMGGVICSRWGTSKRRLVGVSEGSAKLRLARTKSASSSVRRYVLLILYNLRGEGRFRRTVSMNR